MPVVPGEDEIEATYQMLFPISPNRASNVYYWITSVSVAVAVCVGVLASVA
jgi:hypothetical protein